MSLVICALAGRLGRRWGVIGGIRWGEMVLGSDGGWRLVRAWGGDGIRRVIPCVRGGAGLREVILIWSGGAGGRFAACGQLFEQVFGPLSQGGQLSRRFFQHVQGRELVLLSVFRSRSRLIVFGRMGVFGRMSGGVI